MSKILRALIIAATAAFVTTGTAFAQSGAPPAAPMTAATKKPGGNGKCGQTPKGCHKNQPQKNEKKNRKCAQTPKGCHKKQAPAPMKTP